MRWHGKFAGGSVCQRGYRYHACQNDTTTIWVLGPLVLYCSESCFWAKALMAFESFDWLLAFSKSKNRLKSPSKGTLIWICVFSWWRCQGQIYGKELQPKLGYCTLALYIGHFQDICLGGVIVISLCVSHQYPSILVTEKVSWSLE
jgi:hypothetical protein